MKFKLGEKGNTDGVPKDGVSRMADEQINDDASISKSELNQDDGQSNTPRNGGAVDESQFDTPVNENGNKSFDNPDSTTETASTDGKTNVAGNSPEAVESRKEQQGDVKPYGAGTYQGYAADPSAKSVGITEDSLRDPLAETFAEHAAATAGLSEDSEVVYSSHPMQNLILGPYVFEKTVLRLTAAQAVEFDKLLDTLPAAERSSIRKINNDRAQDIIDNYRSSATQQLDSSIGRAALANLQRQNPRIGTVELGSDQAMGFANVPQRDGNEDRIVPTESK